MFIDAGFPAGPDDRRSFRLKLWAAAVGLFLGLVLLGSALSGAWLIDIHSLLHVTARPVELPATEHRCALRATGDWSSCSARDAVRITQCTQMFHADRNPTYDCRRPDARPGFPRSRSVSSPGASPATPSAPPRA